MAPDHSSKSESCTTQIASLPSADATHASCPSTVKTLLPAQGKQSSTLLSSKRRPASAPASKLLRQPTQAFSGISPEAKAALPADNSQVGQHAQHDSLMPPQGSQVQSASHSIAPVAGLASGHLSQRQPSQAMQAKPELGKATPSWSTLRRLLTLTPPPNAAMSQDRSPFPASSGRSPKHTLLRDQHMPGELLHQKSAFLSDIFMRHEAACAGPSPPQPDTASAAASLPGPFSSTLQRTPSMAEAQSTTSGGTTLRLKPTPLREQHLPGEVLHQKSAFPSDIYMRHEAACTPGTAQQPHSDATSVFNPKGSPQPSTAGVAQQEQQQLRQVGGAEASGSAMLRLCAVKQGTLPRAVSFATGFTADGHAGNQAALTPNTAVRSSSAAATIQPPMMEVAAAPRGTGNATALGSSPSHSRDTDALQAAVPCKVQKSGSRDASSRPKSSLKRVDSRLKHSSQAAPATPRSLAGPWFEATSLSRNQTWAKEWLELGVQDDDPTNPELVQLQEQQQLSQRDMEHQSPLLQQQHAPPQPMQRHTLQHPGEQHTEQNISQQQLLHQTPHQAWQGPGTELLPSPYATARSHQNQSQAPGAIGASVDAAEPHTHAMQLQTISKQLTQPGHRPQTAPEGFWSVAVDAPWALDARRLHSARPGSGGSPTARYETSVP